MKSRATPGASFAVVGNAAAVTGSLDFSTVSGLLSSGSQAISEGHVTTVDLGRVTHSDSSGLALLIEWLSVAHEVKRTIRYLNVPVQVHQLARLSEVEELLTAS